MRLLSLRSLPPTPLTLQLLLFTGFIGSLHPRNDGKLLNITLQRQEEGTPMEGGRVGFQETQGRVWDTGSEANPR